MKLISLSNVVVATSAIAYLSARLSVSSPLRTMVTCVFVVPIYLIVWLSWLYPFYFSPLRHIPTVHGFPLWGHFISIITEECGVPQRRWHQQHGLIIRYFFPFGTERLSIANDDALSHMTVRNPYNYMKPDRARLWMARILGQGVLLAEGEDHVHQRKSLAPGFSINSIRALAPAFWTKSFLLAQCWEKEFAANGTRIGIFEVLEWLNRTTLDIITKVAFDYDVHSLEQPDTPLREAYRLVFAFDIWSRVHHGLQSFFPSLKHVPSKMNRDINVSRQIILDKATEIIQQKQKEADGNASGKDIMSLIIRENNIRLAAGEPGLSFETMRDQIMTFLGAGHDTTATGVAWTLHLLSTHRDVQTRLRDEIRTHLPFLFDKSTRLDTNNAVAADPDKLPYLDNVCRESLRYIPPIPMTVRQSIADDNLAGYHIPAGTIVYVHANAINRLPSYWGETADRFEPDRWDNLPSTWTSNAFMTFLQGPRGCIGRKFAETEMKILLCCLLSMYEFEPDQSTDDPEKWKMWRLVLRPKEGISLKVKLI